MRNANSKDICRTFKTPQLLELSGIGDKRVLEKLGVESKVDLPGVGANMQEHITSHVTFGEYLDYLADWIYSLSMYRRA